MPTAVNLWSLLGIAAVVAESLLRAPPVLDQEQIMDLKIADIQAMEAWGAGSTRR